MKKRTIATILAVMMLAVLSVTLVGTPSATAADNIESVQLGLGEYEGETEASQDYVVLSDKKEILSEENMKMSGKILQLTDSEYLPPNTSMSELIDEMVDQKQLKELIPLSPA